VNKKEFIDAIASQHEPLPRAQAARIVDSDFVTIGSAIKRGRKVQVTGFGTFSTVKRKARKDFHPKTREPIRIKVKTVAKFSAGAGLRALLDEKKA
jgi:DNA-binding protein HU-beta